MKLQYCGLKKNCSHLKLHHGVLEMKKTAWIITLVASLRAATKVRIGRQGAHGGIPTHFRNLKIKPLDETAKDR